MTLKTLILAGNRFLSRSSPNRCWKTFSLSDFHHVQLNFLRNCTTSADLFDIPEMKKFLAFITDEKSSIKNVEGSHPQVLQQIIKLYDKKNHFEAELLALDSLPSEGDKEFEKLMEAERKGFTDSIIEIKNEILDNISVLVDDEDNRNVQIQVIPGIGGSEAELFGQELFSMYMNYIAFKKWECTEIDPSTRYISVSGEFVYNYMKHEAGVHRVQRVPETEKQGRTHTSTCSIAVLPVPKSHEVVIKPKDIIVDKKTSSGPGGQNVNKTESCIRVTHKPTGIVVENQTSRYQYENKAMAIERLRCILYNMEHDKCQSEVKALKKKQVGNNEYSDKIRTYHFIQNRVTDHRIGFTMPNVRGFLMGSKELDQMIHKVRELNRDRELLQYLNKVLKSGEFKHFEAHLAGRAGNAR